MGQNTPCTSLYKGAVSPPDLNRHRSKNLCGVTKGATPPSLWFLDPTSAVEVLRGSDHHRRPSILRLCIELVQASQGTQSPPLSLSTSLDYSLLLLFGLCIMSQWTPMCMWFARQFFSIAVSHFFYLARGRFSATPPPVPLVCVRTDCTVYRQALLLLSRYVMGPIFPRPCKCGPQHPSLVSFSVKSACVRAESSALVLGPQRLWPPNRFRSDVYWCPRTLFRTALQPISLYAIPFF